MIWMILMIWRNLWTDLDQVRYLFFLFFFFLETYRLLFQLSLRILMKIVSVCWLSEYKGTERLIFSFPWFISLLFFFYFIFLLSPNKHSVFTYLAEAICSYFLSGDSLNQIRWRPLKHREPTPSSLTADRGNHSEALFF